MAQTTITRKAALENALIFCNYANMEAIQIEGHDIDWVATGEVLGNMLAQVSKPRAKAVSKARKMNENLATEVAKAIPAEGITAKQIVELGNPEITTTQKATAVMRVACDLGLATRVKEGKAVIYKVAE